MPISEDDIAILIPTYRYHDKVGRALESALASGAGEIIVTDDHSRDGTMELLASFDDPRLKVFENPQNLGLWENHLVALEHASRPWVKFIQADDYLLPGGLAAYAAAVEPGVSVVWSCALVKDDETGERMQFHELANPRRLGGKALLDLCLHVGWLLGSPSHMMLRADAVTHDPAAWQTEISADVVIGSIAAAQGDVMLLPPGAIGQGGHARQDAKTQGARRGLRRMIATATYLAAHPEPALQRFALLWARLNQPIARRSALSGALRRQISPVEALRLVLRYRMLTTARDMAWEDRALLKSARTYRSLSEHPHDIDRILSTFRQCSDPAAVRSEDGAPLLSSNAAGPIRHAARHQHPLADTRFPDDA